MDPKECFERVVGQCIGQNFPLKLPGICGVSAVRIDSVHLSI